MERLPFSSRRERVTVPLILNQAAGERIWRRGEWARDQFRKALLVSLEQEGFCPRLFLTRGPGDGTRIAQELVREGAPWILAAGGDGTVNELVNGIAGTETSLGIIPLGTANAFALELGIPFSIREATRTLREGRVRKVDLGRTGGRFFAMGAGVGFDAHTIQKITPGLKLLWGPAAYIFAGVWEAFRYSFPTLQVELEDPPGRSEGHLAIVTNARYYGGPFRPSPQARLDDGLLDILVMKQKRFQDLVGYLWRMRYGDVTRSPETEYFQCRRVRITSDPPVGVHVDAEIAGMTPCEFECVPAFLKVIVPNDRRRAGVAERARLESAKAPKGVSWVQIPTSPPFFVRNFRGSQGVVSKSVSIFTPLVLLKLMGGRPK